MEAGSPMNPSGSVRQIHPMRSSAMTTRFISSDFLVVSVLLALLRLGLAGASEAGDSWQEQMLFNPSATQLELERRGRIMIYDGLKDTQITRAMDTQFDRIQSMMFVRTITTDFKGEALRDKETGDVVIEDDGC
jgi:hypothetical protein